MEHSIITFEHVNFKYQSEDNFSLDDISFSIPANAWTCIVGHNGSGKSTIGKLMTGIEQATSGHININGLEMSEANLTKVRNELGVVLQNPDNQFVGATVEYDVAFGMENRAIPEAEMHTRVTQVLEEVNMLDIRSQAPHSLSGGQKQRVAIAGILAINPNIILLDEANSMLDPIGKASVTALMQRLNKEKGVTIVSITHDLSEAQYADHLIVMHEGRIVEEGHPEKIFEQADMLTTIGLDLPFAIKLNQMIYNETAFITYKGLVDKL